jgi:TolA-binding protein
MQAETPPALTGNYVTKTKEVSVLKMFLQDEDDSGLVEVESKSELAKLSNAKIDVVERLLRDLEARLADDPEASELRDQLARLNATIEERSGSISGLVESRTTVTSNLRARQQEFSELEVEWGDTAALQSRFNILRQRYDRDLARLDTVREAGQPARLLHRRHLRVLWRRAPAPAQQHRLRR